MTMQVNSKSHRYSISFGGNLKEKLKTNHVLVDDYFHGYEFLQSSKSVVCVRAEEKNKDLATVQKVLESIFESNLSKTEELFVIGGGFLQDVGTMAASLYMRGISWNFFPTTLTAMADSCLGGKSSINLKDAKNVIGNFYPPKNIYIDVNFLRTLPLDDYLSGVSEMVKICLAKGKAEFEDFVKKVELDNLERIKVEDWESLISQTLHAKKFFIECDEFDLGVRKLLNFGHTFGHALEAASGYRIPHGIAVAFGMLVACHHPGSEQDSITERLSTYIYALLKRVSRTTFEYFLNIDWQKYEIALKKDKKNTEKEFCPILWNGKELYIARIPFLSQGGPKESTTLASKIICDLLRSGH
jgi:3-dehydroquinate synthase